MADFRPNIGSLTKIGFTILHIFGKSVRSLISEVERSVMVVMVGNMVGDGWLVMVGDITMSPRE